MVVCTVAAVAVVPLTIDLYTPDGSADATVGVTDISGSAGAGVAAPQAGGVAGRAGSTVVDPEPADPEPIDPESAAAVSSAPEPDGASTVLEGSFDPAATKSFPDNRNAAPTPPVAVPSAVPLTPTGAVVDPIGELQPEPISDGSTSGVTDAGAVGESELTDSGVDGVVGSGMGGDLPPEVLPTPAYPQCPITESGPWWTDPADPYTCIPPDPIQFHEPTPPGIPPELLEPIFEEPDAPDTPDGSVGWYEPTPPGIDPSLLEPIMGDAGQPETGE